VSEARVIRKRASIAFHRMEAVRMAVSCPFLAGDSSKVAELQSPVQSADALSAALTTLKLEMGVNIGCLEAPTPTLLLSTLSLGVLRVSSCKAKVKVTPCSVCSSLSPGSRPQLTLHLLPSAIPASVQESGSPLSGWSYWGDEGSLHAKTVASVAASVQSHPQSTPACPHHPNAKTTADRHRTARYDSRWRAACEW